MEQSKSSEPNILNFISHRRRKTAAHFTRVELNQLLMLYAEKNIKGEWRHSTLDQRYGLIAYSVYEDPIERPVFRIIKCNRAHRERGKYVLYQGRKRIKQCGTLTELLMTLRTIRSVH